MAVRMEQVGKRYAGGRPILSDVSLALESGEFCFLTGAAASGKTTLLNILYLAELPSAGRLTLFGGDTGKLDRPGRARLRRRIGFVFQNPRIVEDLDAAGNLALPLRIAGAAEREIAQNVAEMLAWLGIETRGNAPAATLPRRDRQLIATGRAIIARPPLLLADEPAGTVDEDTALLLMHILERINGLGTTVLVATRDTAFAGRFEHRTVHLQDGRLSAAASADPP